MLQKFYSRFSRRKKEECPKINPRLQALQKHWLSATLANKKSLLPIPDEARLEIPIGETQDPRQELNEIRKRLSILEEKTLCKSCL